MEHRDTAKDAATLGWLCKKQGKYEQAEPLYVRALAIYEQQLGTAHPHTQVIRGNYASLRHTTGRDEEATRLDRKRIPSS